MKRGFVGLIALVLLLILPGVSAADSIASLFFGSTQESILFLRLIYAALVFIIFLKGAKESVFKEKEQAKLANVFALILAFFAMRFTPESALTAFGWVIMLIAPIMILYKLSGSIIKTEKDKFSWLRFILAIIGTLFIFLALGSYSGFSSSIGGTPLIGGFFDELFAGLNYFIFYKLSWFFILAIVVILLFLLFSLISKFAGTSSATGGTPGTGFGSSFGKGLLAVLLIGAAIALIGWLMGGLAFAPLAGIFGILSQYLYYALIAMGIILLAYLFFRFRCWRIFSWLFGALGWTLRNLVGGIGRGVGAAARGTSGNNLFVILQTPTQTLPHRNVGAARDPINVNPGSITPFLFTVSRGRFKATASPLDNAAIEIIVNNRAPVRGSTNAQGQFRTVYTVPQIVGTATMQVQVVHPSLSPLAVVQDYQINIGTPVQPIPQTVLQAAVQGAQAGAPAMRVMVNWVPDPAPSNRYMLMNFTVVDNAAITPIAAAVITVNTRPALNIPGGNVQTTNARGQLTNDMRLMTTNPVPPGRVQNFALTIMVNHPAYPVKTSRPILINFVAQGARGGGPQSITF
ncbi:hypothetical protein HZA98_05325 [Candidatus Woesearchaeota archaeon]|nr:hypothetical protein [Candidatus Woesearchaeota archaeon]